MHTAAKTSLDALKTALKNVVHRAAEATVEYIANKIADILWNQSLLLMRI